MKSWFLWSISCTDLARQGDVILCYIQKRDPKTGDAWQRPMLVQDQQESKEVPCFLRELGTPHELYRGFNRMWLAVIGDHASHWDDPR